MLPKFGHPALDFASRAAVGVLILSYVVFGLAVFQVVSRWSLWVVLVVVILIALLRVLKTVSFPSPLSSPRRGEGRVRGWKKGLAPFALGLVYIAWLLLCLTLPPTDRDELIYHLEIPRRMLESGGLAWFQDNIYGYFPQLGEMLFLLGLGTAGEAAARLFHAAAGFLTAAALFGFSRAYLTTRQAFLAAVVFLTVPSVVEAMPLAYVDLIFSLFAFLAFAACAEYFKTGRLAWAIFAGWMTGAAAAAKYTGFQFTILVVIFILAEHLLKRRRGFPAAACLVAAGPLLLALPYLIRNWLYTGWPLFPFQIGNLPLKPGINWDPERARLYLAWLGHFGAPLGANGFWYSLFAPALVFLQGKFNDPRFYEGVIGPVFLLIPFLFPFLPSEKRKGLKLFLLFPLLFLYYWAFTSKQIRFLFPILPLLSFLLVYGIANMKSDALRKAGFAVVIGCAAAGFFIGAGRVWAKDPLAFWTGKESREAYLRRQWKGYRIYEEANKRLSTLDQLYLIQMKNYGYYLDGRFRTDFVFERYILDRVLAVRPSAEDVSLFFNTLGITYLAIDESVVTSQEWGMEDSAREAFWKFLNRFAEPVFQNEGHTLYRLFVGHFEAPQAPRNPEISRFARNDNE